MYAFVYLMHACSSMKAQRWVVADTYIGLLRRRMMNNHRHGLLLGWVRNAGTLINEAKIKKKKKLVRPRTCHVPILVQESILKWNDTWCACRTYSLVPARISPFGTPSMHPMCAVIHEDRFMNLIDDVIRSWTSMPQCDHVAARACSDSEKEKENIAYIHACATFIKVRRRRKWRKSSTARFFSSSS